MGPEQFASTTPRFEPEKYFTGRTHSWGVFEGSAADPRKRFRTKAEGHWEHDTLVLSQVFTFDDGTTQHRKWRLKRMRDNRYVATANDVVGRGVGEARGNAFRWEYTVALQPGNPLSHVRLKQWMYLQDDGRTVLNRGTVRKFGFQVAQVSEVFTRE